jgi:hypothetical protein
VHAKHPLGLSQIGHRLIEGARVDVEQRDAVAVRQEPAVNGQADAACAPGDDGDAQGSGEISHGSSTVDEVTLTELCARRPRPTTEVAVRRSSRH